MTENANHDKSWFLKKIAAALKDYSELSIQKTYLSLLVRWYPQINCDCADSYSVLNLFRKHPSETKSKIEAWKNKLNKKADAVANGNNYRISKKSFADWNNFVENYQSVYPEHNPPVAVMVEKLLVNLGEFKNANYDEDTAVNYINKIFNDNKYCVILINKDTRDKVDQEYKSAGTWFQRCKIMDCKFQFDAEKKSQIMMNYSPSYTILKK